MKSPNQSGLLFLINFYLIAAPLRIGQTGRMLRRAKLPLVKDAGLATIPAFSEHEEGVPEGNVWPVNTEFTSSTDLFFSFFSRCFQAYMTDKPVANARSLALFVMFNRFGM